MMRELLAEVKRNRSKIAKLEANVNTLHNFIFTRSQVRQPAPLREEGGYYIIGDEISSLRVRKGIYDNIIQKSTTAVTFVLKFLAPESGFFTDEELVQMNWNGGKVPGKDVEKGRLMDDERFKAILAQAKENYPGQTIGPHRRTLIDAVNNKCRKGKERISRKRQIANAAVARNANQVQDA